MRLIDADELKTNLWNLYCHYACNGSDLNKAAALNVCLSTVDIQEEIEAIPVEWIEKKIKQINKAYSDIYSEQIRFMLDDWRKENESNIGN